MQACPFPAAVRCGGEGTWAGWRQEKKRRGVADGGLAIDMPTDDNARGGDEPKGMIKI